MDTWQVSRVWHVQGQGRGPAMAWLFLLLPGGGGGPGRGAARMLGTLRSSLNWWLRMSGSGGGRWAPEWFGAGTAGRGLALQVQALNGITSRFAHLAWHDVWCEMTFQDCKLC